MVIQRIRNQVTEVRIITVLFISILFLEPIAAKDFGTHGAIFPVEEIDPIQLIQQKLKVMEENGELAQRNLELQKKTQVSVERPKSVTAITKATKGRVFTYDPTYEVKEDLYDHQGHDIC